AKTLAGQQTNQHTTMHTKIKNKYIGTLLSSQTTSTHHKKIKPNVNLSMAARTNLPNNLNQVKSSSQVSTKSHSKVTNRLPLGDFDKVTPNPEKHTNPLAKA
ncbi:hypothetical protein, partial [Corynebacterium accolens]|uniref:hypothetical protein n=1 Tax=Corynebacterium accolens TaxID=38284 RepID=UPI001AD8130F